MTSDANSRDRANIAALVANAKRLGLTWGIRPATVSIGTEGTAHVQATYDGDNAKLAMLSLLGEPLDAGDRVMVISVPPAANYIVGRLGSSFTSYRFVDTQRFTSSGTFFLSNYPGIKAIRVRMVGGGGGGGGAVLSAAATASMGSGGQAGGYSESFILASALASSVTVTRGAGGTGVNGAAGNPGTDSSFGASVTALGGIGGSAGGAGAGGGVAGTLTLNGVGTGNIVAVAGSGGGVGIRVSNTGGSGGAGGDSLLGPGGKASAVNGGVTGGFAAGIYGGGGGGAFSNNGAAQTGGAGANGIVLVDVYI